MQLEALDLMLEDASVEGLEALVALCRGLASELDANPSSDLWREYRMSLKLLREALASDSAPSQNVVDLLARLGGTGLRDAADFG